jgi:uncharacterized protein YdcH (DUF465 family)
MLGENHSLLHDFPDYKEQIQNLINNDSKFAEDTKRYNALDKEIRTLELRDSPIDDIEMHKLKARRAELKDELFDQFK